MTYMNSSRRTSHRFSARAPEGALRLLLIVAALTALSVGCGEEESQRSQAFPFGDGSVLIADSGFPSPVIVAPLPDAGSSPGSDAGIVIPQIPVVVPPISSDAGTMDAGAMRDAGSLIDGGPAFDGGSSGDAAAGNPCGAGPEPLAANIRIHELSIYQTVKVPLYRNNAWVTMRNAAVVQNKKSLVRAFVTPGTGFMPHALRAVLTLETDGKVTALSAQRTISRASTDDAADSTFDFQVDGALIRGSTKISIAVTETTCMPPAGNAGARLPASDGQALNADAINKLRVVLVPVTLSGRTPDTSQAQLDKMRDALLAHYPVGEVEVSARAAVTYSGAAGAQGTGWSEILSLVGRTRQQDAPASSVYYYGLIVPAATFRDYCRTGCVLGLAPLTSVVSRNNQIGLGIGYVDVNTPSTLVHELGHAHGLPHAPCSRGGSIEGADSRFPYTGAKIGSWGWDSRSNKLLSPATYLDMMSYCEPAWISDYNYTKLATRSKAVNTAAFVYADDDAAQETWSGIILHGDGSARWSGMTSNELPGEVTVARALDAQGSLLRKIEVVRVALSHDDDSFLYVSDRDSDWAAIDLGDRIVQRAQIAPALE